MHPDSVQKTAFRVPWGLFEFTRMPQGLVNSPSTFERLMELVLGEFNLTELVIYLDDILVFSASVEEHLSRLEKAFQRLSKFSLKLNPAKCEFFKHEVRFLGHVVNGSGISTDPEKVRKILAWPRPSNSEQLSSFPGLASYYRKYIDHFSQVAGPLHALVSKGRVNSGKGQSRDFQWSDKAEDAFVLLKSKLCKAPVLAYPDFGKDFVVEVDASLSGLGACLSQYDAKGDLHPIAFASRCLRGAGKKYPDYSSFKIELLALKWAVTEKFRGYLRGAHTIVLTDHNPLAYLKTATGN